MRSRTARLASLFVLAGCAATGGRQESPRVLNRQEPVPSNLALHGRQLSFGVGPREFDDEDLGELDDQVALTLDYCEPMGLDWLRLEGGFHFIYDEADETRAGGEEVRLKSEILELSAGVNHTFLVGRLRPYVGLGGALGFFELRGLDEERDFVFDDDDVAIGGYAKAGMLFQVSRTAHVGVEYRHFEGNDVSLDGTQLDTGYDQVLFVFGTSFDTEPW